MFHLAAFGGSVANTGNVEIPALNDQILSIRNSRFVLPIPMDLLWVWNGSASVTRSRLVGPMFRSVVLPYIIPLDLSVTPPDLPNVMDLRFNPVRLRQNEEYTVEHSQGGAGAENAYAVIALGVSTVPAPRGNVYTLLATGTTTVTAGAWTDCTLTWDQQLPDGEYACVGGHAQSTTGVAWRIILDNQTWRPGGLCLTALTNRAPDFQYGSQTGDWGHFVISSLPRFQILCNAADTVQNLFLQCVKVR